MNGNQIHRLRRTVILLALTAATAGTGLTAGAAEGERPCRNDVMNHCGDHFGDQEGMRGCIREKFSSFSEQCQAALRERQQQGQDQGQGQRGRTGTGSAESAEG